MVAIVISSITIVGLVSVFITRFDKEGPDMITQLFTKDNQDED